MIAIHQFFGHKFESGTRASRRFPGVNVNLLYDDEVRDRFREFAFPSLKKVVSELVLRGITPVTPVLHCDGNWDRNLDDLHELPKGKVILQLDSATGIFRAKEVIGEHCCLFGDVPSTMLAFGNKQEVFDYCKKLIDVVDKNGGFILAAGCEIPPNARPENVKGMIDAATQSGDYR